MADGFRYEEARAFALACQHPSTAEIKRHLGVGYNEAAAYMERLEAEGVVSAPNHVGQRTVLRAGDAA